MREGQQVRDMRPGSRLRGLFRRERGQMLIIFAMLIMPVTFVLGAVAVDAALWQSERRGAYKDADLSALAGAYELLDRSQSPAAMESAAIDAADAYQKANDEAENAGMALPVEVGSSCFGTDVGFDSVTVTVEHRSRQLFTSIFGNDLLPQIGARAKACAGSIVSTSGLRPYGIESQPLCLSDGTCIPPADADCFELGAGIMVPRFGSWCQLDDGSQDGSTSQRGLIRLGTSATGPCGGTNSGNNVSTNIRHGSQATCRIGDPVSAQPGGQDGNDITQGIRPLLNGQGTPAVADGTQCDKRPWGNNNTIDDLSEVVERIDGGSSPSPDAVYQLRTCVSPRVVHVVIIDRFPSTPSQSAHIVGFAAFYILGCKTPNQGMSVLPNKCTSNAQRGQQQLWGVFLNMLELDGDVGAFDPFGTHRIALVE